MVSPGIPTRSTRADPLDVADAPRLTPVPDRPGQDETPTVGPSRVVSTTDGRDGANRDDRALMAQDAILGQAGSENFPVASRILPARSRRHLMAVYGFARLVDDIGDEATGDRVTLLDWLEAELHRAAAGTATHPLMQGLSPMIAELNLPLQPFVDLIEANRQDQLVSRYQTFDDLVAYCMLSAAPVGRLVLYVLGAWTPWRQDRSDDVCIGLQLVEHLQDVAEDLAQDRVYIPLDDLERIGCTVEDLAAPVAGPEFRRVVALESGRAWRLLGAGNELAASLPVRERIEVAAFTAGGLASIDAIERAGYDVLAHRCRPRGLRLAARVVGVLARPSRVQP
jgi:squalene synthase HpnC